MCGKHRCASCERIASAATAREKAHAALDACIDSGGYDHWDDVEKYARQAEDGTRTQAHATPS